MYFDTSVSTELCEIMGRYGSDKGNKNLDITPHNYTQLYYNLFNPIRYQKLRIFELGLGTNNISLPSNMGPDGKPGASLKGWSEFFPNSEIFGADIDKNILFNEDRIKTFYCDQRNPAVIASLWENNELKENFDIIIEDGLHDFNANICFFENSIHKLKKGGYYIIEDININTLPFENLFDFYKKNNLYTDYEFNIIKMPILKNCSVTANNLIVIKYK